MRYLLLIFLILINISCRSQVLKCDTITKKNVYYVSFEIKSKKDYPVKMMGIFENYNPESFNKQNTEAFIKSFYNSGIYTPFTVKGYKKMLCECIQSTDIDIYLNKNSSIITEIAQNLENSSSMNTIILDSGDMVVLKVLKIKGVFFKTNKNSKGIFVNSMEWEIEDINEIKYVYVPFDKIKIVR